MKGILVASLFFFAVPAFAVTYEWIDDNGTVNFAENLGSVPKKYRKKAKVLGTEDSTAPEVLENEGSKAKEEDGKAEVKEKAVEKEASKKTTVYGGKDEAAWKAEYRKLAADLKAAEEHLDQLNARLSDPGKMSRSEYLSVQHTIKNTDVRLSDLRKKMDAFESAAAKAGVPPGYRE